MQGKAMRMIRNRLRSKRPLPMAYSAWTDMDYSICPTLTTKAYDYTKTGQIVLFVMENKEEEMASEYELSDAMQRYIVSKDRKYIGGKNVLNPSIARCVTTREGQTRADTSTYLSPDCPPDCEIIADEDGYPRRKDMETDKRLRIRKLTEGECYRFMGFQRKDYEACVKAGQSKSSIYHQAGDSIVTTCLVGIFGELFGLDYERIIQDYADGLHKEVTE